MFKKTIATLPLLFASLSVAPVAQATVISNILGLDIGGISYAVIWLEKETAVYFSYTTIRSQVSVIYTVLRQYIDI